MLTVPPVLAVDPTSYSPGSTPQPPNLSLATGTITAGPDRVWDLVRPITLDGAQAYGNPASGQIAVQTSIGMLVVQTPDAAVPLGVPLTIRLTPGDPPTITFMPPQGTPGQPGTPVQQGGVAPPPQGTVAPVEAPAVLLTDISAGAETLMPGQIVILTSMVRQSTPSSLLPPSSTAVDVAVQESEGQIAVPSQFATMPAGSPATMAGGPTTIANPPIIVAAGTNSVGLLPATGPELAGTLLPAYPVALPPASSPGPIPLDPTTTVANAPPPAGTPILSATLAAPSPAIGGMPTPQAPAEPTSAVPARGVIVAGSDQILPSLGKVVSELPVPSSPPSPPVQEGLPQSSDLAGLPSALAAQFPAGDPSIAAASPTTAGLDVPNDEDSSFSARIIAVVPAGEPLPVIPAGATVLVVEGSTLAGQPILHADDRSLVVQTPASIQPGTRLIVERVDPAVAHAARLPTPLDPVSGHNWPALAEALSTLADSHLALAEAMRMAIPQTGPLLGPVLLLFVAGLRRGNAQSWLGDAPLNELRRAGHADLASVLSSDFERASRQSAQSVDDGWHTLPIPIFAEGALSRIQLHLRRYKKSDDQGENGADGEDRGSLRFIVEAEPSATGPVQLDGFVRPPLSTAPPALDLIVRSQTPLAPDMRTDIVGLFTNSLAVAGLRGAIVFQGGMSWVKVARDRASAASVIA